MTKKRVSIVVIITFILISLFLVYWFYFSKPTALPADDELAKQMNEIFPEANVETIQETIQLDQDHVYVPFISSKDTYGASYWVWERRKWRPVYIDTVGEPIIWMIDGKKPSSSFIVWNLHPDDQISHANFALVRERGFHISNNEHNYTPRIQMENEVSLKEESYGALELPEDWQAFLNQENKRASLQKSHINTTSIFPDIGLYIGWTPYNEKDEISFPESSVNGHGFYNGDIETDFVRFINESELEE
ncbi:hypothetical protein CEY16_13040 [Halalkalibacillus sediminis]|uniref:Uncharacterized protein n=1 Tax=Halalkalibacillus sediminis TaxID=2018042 RepID=A0A2I0QQZ3_9BACI|nr:hypothetical protein [Halalkalibacillus sediminis]PKR76739.1 hypothetical protein CEY16_13040 [Halalkalibacillus sediminis]